MAEILHIWKYTKPIPKRLRDRNRKRAGKLRAKGWKKKVATTP